MKRTKYVVETLKEAIALEYAFINSGGDLDVTDMYPDADGSWHVWVEDDRDEPDEVMDLREELECRAKNVCADEY